MKAMIILFVLGLATTQVHAQRMNAKDIPDSVKSSLEKYFAVKDADWDKEGANYEASFEQRGTEISVVFDGAGSVLETEREIKKNELPAAILETLTKDYSNFEVEETARIETKGVVTYEVEVEKGRMSMDIIFDEDGKQIMKQVNDKKEKGQTK